MGNTFYMNWEPALMEWIQSFMGPFLTTVASICSMFGEEMILLAVLGFLYWVYDKKYAQYVGDNLVFGITLNPMVKNLVLRLRPYMVHDQIRCLKPVDSSADIYDIGAQGYSFPSGHSLNSVVVYGSIARYQNTVKKKPVLWITLGAVLLPLFVGISRFMVGVHYPTDVLCGWILGAAIVLLEPLLRQALKKRWLFHLVLIILALPGLFYCRTSDYFTGLGMMIGFFLAVPFEEKYVNFENTRNIIRGILRVAGGFAVYFGLNSLLKLPFSKDFLSSGTLLAYCVRTVRYAIVVFVMMGVYPMLFKFWKSSPK